MYEQYFFFFYKFTNGKSLNISQVHKSSSETNLNDSFITVNNSKHETYKSMILYGI